MTRRLVAAILFILLALLCAGFVRLNTAPARVELFVANLGTTVGQALIVAFVLGWVAGALGALSFALRLARERSALAKALRLAEGEVRTLRATQPAHAR